MVKLLKVNKKDFSEKEIFEVDIARAYKRCANEYAIKIMPYHEKDHTQIITLSAEEAKKLSMDLIKSIFGNGY